MSPPPGCTGAGEARRGCEMCVCMGGGRETAVDEVEVA